METRNITLTLEKAKEFYNSGNKSLREIALQAFTEEELKSPDFMKIKTFEDACKALNLCQRSVDGDIINMGYVESKLGNHLIAIYKLDIIRKALNGPDWNPKITEGTIYHSWVKIYSSNDIPSDGKIVATFKSGGQEYFLIGGLHPQRYYNGMSGFNPCGYGYLNADSSLLCCKSPEIAQYMSEQFGKLIFDACYAQHIGAYEWLPTPRGI